MAFLPFDNFLCWKLKVAVMAICIFTIGAGLLAGILEVLDIAAFADDNFEISGGFRSPWRAHVWEGWLAINLVMMFCHIFMIAYSIVIIIAVKRFPTYYEFNLTRIYMVMFVCYTLIELGCSIYKYSWYGAYTFRLGYLVFTFIYWLVRLIVNILAILVLCSRLAEVHYEIQYGEKKDLSNWASRANLLDSRSGLNTPVRR